jgi:hypothetical protein
MHALVASTLAGPPAGPGRTYDGSQDVEAAQDPATVPPAPAPASAPADPAAAETPAPVGEPAPPKPAPIVAGDPMLPTAEDSTPEGPEDADELPYDPLVDSPEAKRARSWVRSGAIFTTIGGVLTIGAIAMSAARVNTMEDQNVCNPRSDPAGNGCLEAGRNRAVAALAFPGVLLLGGGIAMLAVGKVQQKRLRTSLRAGRHELFVGLRLSF